MLLHVKIIIIIIIIIIITITTTIIIIIIIIIITIIIKSPVSTPRSCLPDSRYLHHGGWGGDGTFGHGLDTVYNTDNGS